MDVNRLTTGQKIAAASGVALLLIMIIFPWFGVNIDGAPGGFDGNANAWEAFGGIDLILFLAAASAIAVAIESGMGIRMRMPVAPSAIVAGLGIVATLLVLYRIIDPPGPDLSGLGVDIGRKFGVFLGLLASAGVAYGGWRAMQEEGTSFAEARDQLGDAISGDRDPAPTQPQSPASPPPPATTPPASAPGEPTPPAPAPPGSGDVPPPPASGGPPNT